MAAVPCKCCCCITAEPSAVGARSIEVRVLIGGCRGGEAAPYAGVRDLLLVGVGVLLHRDCDRALSEQLALQPPRLKVVHAAQLVKARHAAGRDAVVEGDHAGQQLDVELHSEERRVLWAASGGKDSACAGACWHKLLKGRSPRQDADEATLRGRPVPPASPCTHRGTQLDEPAVKVLARKDLQVLVHDLAALEVAVVEVADDALRLGDDLEELALVDVLQGAVPLPRQLHALLGLLLQPRDALRVQALQLGVIHQLVDVDLLVRAGARLLPLSCFLRVRGALLAVGPYSAYAEPPAPTAW
jgi:hypothetical protein